MTRRPPDQQLVNVDAEKLFLGSLMLSEHAFWAVEGSIRPDTFIVQVHRDLFNNISDVLKSGGKLSHAVLCTRLPEETDGPNGDPVTTRSYLAALTHNAEAAGVNPSDLASQLSELAARRQAIQIGERLIKAARVGDKATVDIAAEAEASLLDVMQTTAPRRPRRLSEIARVVHKAALAAKDSDVLPGFNTGISSLDEILGLVLPHDLGFILGAQGDGKSALATQIGMHVANTHPVVMFQLEMAAEQIAARELASAANLSVREIQEGTYSAAGSDALVQAGITLNGPEFWIHDEPNLSVRRMRSHCLAMKRVRGLGLVIVDHLRLIKSDNRHRDRWERQAEFTGELKTMAKELNVAVICLAQRTRTAQRRDDPTPMVDDADAPSLDQDGDWIIGLWRKESWLRRNRPNAKAGGEAWDKWEGEIARCKDIAEVICLKRRRGRAFEQRQLSWDGEHTKFGEI